MLNLINYTNCICLVIEFGAIGNTMSIIIMVISGICFLAAFIRFYLNPDPCDYFRYSFKLTTLALSHYLIMMLMLVLAVILLAVFFQLNWPPLIPCMIMCLYTLIYRPYQNTSDNIRSALNILAMSVFIGFRMYASQCSQLMLK